MRPADAAGRTKVWAYAHYDALPSPGDDVTPEDINAVASFGLRLTRNVLQGFHDVRDQLANALSDLPLDVPFDEASDDQLKTIESLHEGLLTGEGDFPHKILDADRTLISAVLHRKRPRLIPLYNRVVSDRYTRGLGDKAAGRGINLLMNIRADLRHERNRRALAEIQQRLANDLGGKPVPSRIRLFDIAMWMDSRSPP